MDQNKIRKHFDELAYCYDRKRVKYFNLRLNRELLSQIEVPVGSKVLEVGVGTGSLFKELNSLYDCYGVDISEKMIEITRMKTNSFKLQVAEGGKLPYENNQFDCVISVDVLEHVDDFQSFLYELKRVLKSGGQVILSTPNPLWTPMIWVADFLNMMADEGEHRFLWMQTIAKKMRKIGYSNIELLGPIFVPVAPPTWLDMLAKIERKISRSLLKSLSFTQLIKAQK